MQPLDRDHPLEARDAHEAREEHRGHAPARQLGDELVSVEALALAVRRQELRQGDPSTSIQ